MSNNKLNLDDIVIQSFITDSTAAQSFVQSDNVMPNTINGNPTITEPLPTNNCAIAVADPTRPFRNATTPETGCNIAPPGFCNDTRAGFCNSKDFGWTGMYVCRQSAQTSCQKACPSEKNMLYPKCDGGFNDSVIMHCVTTGDQTLIPYQCGQPTKVPGLCYNPNGTKNVLECPPKSAAGATCQFCPSTNNKKDPICVPRTNNCESFNAKCMTADINCEVTSPKDCGSPLKDGYRIVDIDPNSFDEDDADGDILFRIPRI